MAKQKYRDIQQRIRAVIDAMEDNPRPPSAKKLQGEKSVWRIRVGDYRIVYEIQNAKLVVLVIRIGHRKDIYRKGT